MKRQVRANRLGLNDSRSGGYRHGVGLAAAVALLVAGTACGGGGDSEGAEGGPEPTHPIERDVDGETGDLEVLTDELSADGVDGFGGGTVYYPDDDSQRYGVIAAAPGLGADESMVSWYGDMLASHGFVVLTMNTHTLNDSPDQRGEQILAALDHAVEDSAAAKVADPDRLGVLGHSMGGGGALVAAADRPEIRSVVSLTPYYEGDREDDWSDVVAPTLIIGGSTDEVAPVSDHAEPLYDGLDKAKQKAYLNLNGDHFIANSPSEIVTEHVLAWTKRFVDGDKSYADTLCPAPSTNRDIDEVRDTCPHE